MKFKTLLAILISSLLVLIAGAVVLCIADTPEPYQPEKRTVLQKYVTAQAAYERWQQSPQSVHIIDCRTPEEYVYVGHAPMAVNIPSKLGVWDPSPGELILKDNPHFEILIQQRFKKTDTLMIMCRSGIRGAESVNRLAAIGFLNAYVIVDGFEGDVVKDKHSAYKGKRLRNGWKNALAPWTYDLAPENVYRLPAMAE